MISRIFAAIGFLTFVFCGLSQAQVNLNPIGVDPENYQCYPVTNSSGFDSRGVRLRDQFGLASVKVVQPALICAPVSKNGELVADTKSHLVCYTLSGGQKAGKRVEIVNQFGKLQFDVNNATLLCVPSLKRV